MIYKRIIKPFFDRLVALVFLLALSWLFVLIVLGYWLTGETSIFFRQLRTGFEICPFHLIKFRTLKNAEGPVQLRRFRWGDFLRKTSLDELPQLWNVVRGEMSLVGPRPLPVAYVSLMTERQKKRHQVKPGITGWAQVNGRHRISWQRKFELDLYYTEHVSFWLDFRIVFKTVILLLSFHKDHSLAEAPFSGNT